MAGLYDSDRPGTDRLGRGYLNEPACHRPCRGSLRSDVHLESSRVLQVCCGEVDAATQQGQRFAALSYLLHGWFGSREAR